MQHEIFTSSLKFHTNLKSGLATQKTVKDFQDLVWDYYQKHGRMFPWRQTFDPYHILVSEIMLQQTQTHRVQEKYQQFIKELPDFKSLAAAPQKEVLRLWQGLGYNRRAIALQKSTQKIVEDYDGVLPCAPEILVNFPGIGPATAASICAFAFNKPTVFIETNIRTVFIHHFFQDAQAVHDKKLIPLIDQMVDKENARQWYYALMDYGVMLKKKFKNPSRSSAHHVRQSKFEGSGRQIRGAILKLLLEYQKLKREDLFVLLEDQIGCGADRADKIIKDLEYENFIQLKNSFFML